MKRALITGIKGFTGRYLAAELEAHGWEVWGIGSHLEPGDDRYRRVDLADVDGLKRVVAEVQPDVVAHLAAIAFVGHGNADEFYKVNLIGSRNLLAALASCDRKPECVLLASSANVYGNAAAGALTEATPPNPANDYAVSKIAMEYMARLWMDRLPVVIARPFNYTGPGQAVNFVIPKLVDHFARRASAVELGNLHVEREFNDVRMVCRVYRALLEKPMPGEVFNVCSGQPYTLQYVIDVLSQLSRHQLEVRVNPAFVRANEVHRLCGSPAKLTDAVGDLPFSPLNSTLQWMLEEAQSQLC